MNTTFKVNGMTCGNCARHVEEAIRAVPGVAAVEVDLAGAKATVTGSGAPEAIVAALADEGYEASVA
jgi:copper chaperone